MKRCVHYEFERNSRVDKCDVKVPFPSLPMAHLPIDVLGAIATTIIIIVCCYACCYQQGENNEILLTRGRHILYIIIMIILTCSKILLANDNDDKLCVILPFMDCRQQVPQVAVVTLQIIWHQDSTTAFQCCRGKLYTPIQSKRLSPFFFRPSGRMSED